MTSIQWTDRVWNPVIGCTRVSAGCTNCYAERDAARKSTNPKVPAYAGLASFTPGGPRWSGEVRVRPEKLAEPLSWQKPQRVFVNSMSDLFHEDVPAEFIAAVFGVMASRPHLTFQVLTKRPERMRRWFTEEQPKTCRPLDGCRNAATHHGLPIAQFGESWPWPLPNVHLGVSVEDQATADERIPILLDTPAAVRFVSAEPLLGPLEFSDVTKRQDAVSQLGRKALDGIGWVIVGGESGPDARPCDVGWIRSVVRQCREADVACFVKQLGARPTLVAPMLDEWPHHVQWRMDESKCTGRAELRDARGGDPSEWPEDLRWRQFPEVPSG